MSLKHDNYIKDRKNVTIFLGEEIKMNITNICGFYNRKEANKAVVNRAPKTIKKFQALKRKTAARIIQTAYMCDKKRYTKDQITKAIKTIKSENDCPILLDDTPLNPRTIIVTKCNHAFNRDALLKWLEVSPHKNCPSCRSIVDQIDVILDVIRNTKKPSDKTKALRMLCRLADSPANRKTIANTGVISDLLDAIRNTENSFVKEAALGLLCRLADSPANRKTIANTGVISDLLDAIRNTENSFVKEAALGLLCNIAILPECRKAIADDEFMPVLVNIVNNPGNDRIKGLAQDALEILSTIIEIKNPKPLHKLGLTLIWSFANLSSHEKSTTRLNIEKLGFILIWWLSDYLATQQIKPSPLVKGYLRCLMLAVSINQYKSWTRGY